MRAIARAAVIVAAVFGAALCALTPAQSQQSKSEKEPTGSIAGRITLEGKAAAGVTVLLMPLQPGSRLSQTLKTTSEVEGEFKFTRVPAGSYRIQTFTPTFVDNEHNDPYS